MEINETHEKIVNIIQEKGPSLPIQIAKKLDISSLFISAFLSELSKQKRIKISHLKVGGSPLYFIEGQEEQLEPFYKYLHPREAEAFLLLKKNEILKDSEQKPAIRVALRSIRDFSIGFKKQDEIFWRYFSVPEIEITKTLEPEKEKEEEKPKPTSKPIPKPTTKSTPKPKKSIIKSKKSTDFQNPLIIKEKPKKQKTKSEFVENMIEILKNRFTIIEEKDYKAKEYNCIIQIKSELGTINFLTQAKDKKSISETDLKKLLSNAQSIPLPAFLLYTGKLSKKAQEFAQTYSSVLKIKKI